MTIQQTSKTFFAEVYNPSETYTVGPLYNILRFRYDLVMDGLTSWEMEMALGDPYPRVGIQQHDKVVISRVDQGLLTVVYRGIVDFARVDSKSGRIQLKGFGEERELCWTPAGELNIWTEESQNFDAGTWLCYVGWHHPSYDPHNTEYSDEAFPWGPFTLRGNVLGTAVDDSEYMYFGRDRIWHDLVLTLGSTNEQDRTAQWQYYNGQTGGWADLTVVDGTLGHAGTCPFHNSGTVSFTAPDDWVASVHDSHNYYWVRVRTTQTTRTDDITITGCTCLVIVPTATPLADFVIPILPAGWTITGLGETEHEVFAQFTQESIFEVLVKIAEQTGEHFIMSGTAKDLHWIGTGPLVNPIEMYFEQEYSQADELSRAVALDVELTKETYDLISRVYPYGGGDAGAQVTLEKATDSPPVGYTVDYTNNFVAYDAAEDPSDAGYIGIISKRIYCPEIGVDTVEPPKDEHAANALLAKAVAYLSRRCVLNNSWAISVSGLTRKLYPGDPVWVNFRKYYQGTNYITLDQRLIIVKFTEELGAEGIKHTLIVSTTDMLAKTDAEKVAEFIGDDYTRRGHPQSVPAKNLATTKAVNSSLFANGKGGMILRTGGSDGSTFDAEPHDLLSATHDDTLEGAPVRGDLVVANSTPLWARLPAGDPGDVLTMGAADPEWAPAGGAIGDHDHSGDPGDGGTFDAANLTSGIAGDGDVLTADGIGGAAWEAIPAPHDPVSLDADAANILDLVGQEIGLDVQDANTFLAGPASGAANEPDFRALDVDDLPAHTHTVKKTMLFKWTGTLSAYTGVLRGFPDGNWTILEVMIAINTAPTGADVIVDVHKNGTTIFTTQANRPTIAAGAYAGTSAAPDVQAATDADYLTFDIDQVGSTIAGADLTIHIRAEMETV